MHITGLTTMACLAVYVSGAAVFWYAAGVPSRKRQGNFLDDFGLADDGGTRTSVYLLPLTTSTTLAPSTPHPVITITKPLFPDLGGVLFPPNGPTTTDSFASSTVSSTSSPTHTRTSISLSSTKSAVVLPISSDTLTVPSMGSTVPDLTSWKSTTSPSSTSSAVPISAASTNSTWKTVGIAVSVVTLVGLTILLVVFFEQWTAFVRDVFLCRSHRDQDPLGDEEFLPDKYYGNCDTGIRSHNGKWAREIRESARLSNIRYPTDVFFGDGSTLGPGQAGIGTGGGAGRSGVGVGEFGQLDRPSRPSFLQRLSMISLRGPSPVSPRIRMKAHSPGIGNYGDGFTASALSPPKISAC